MSSPPPPWFDESRLRKAWYAADDYSGWVIDLGDGTCRYVNHPLLGCDDDDNPHKDEINAAAPRWGDRVPLIESGDDDLPRADASRILERWRP